ncbi:winged helix-turn-helix domain-containing protein [Acidothermaceae bacterium B102]|nr:winged helix-turn-helix domain-containing protein [Acidothermaceae bacterium B102]
MPVEEIALAQARRIALAAQGFARPRPTGRIDGGHLGRVVDGLGLLQIDSVNVLSRAHYLPAYSRLGPYPRERLDQLTWGSGRVFEYWAHEASFLPAQLWPLFRWRMEARRGHGTWGSARGLIANRPGYIEDVLEEVRDRGPLSAREVSDAVSRKGAWWSWSDAKVALEALFATGDVTVFERVNFERRYDLPERVLPAAVVEAPVPTEDEARRELLRISARALGVATATDLYDYFRLNGPVTAPRLAELVEAGDLTPVTVRGWSQPAYLAPGARLPRRITARALLSPFDSMVFERSRLERLFDFRYRIEIYVPAPKRIYGYYVLPFLLGERFVARVDLKADRATGVLVVQAAWSEPDAPPDTVEELADELVLLAGWLGLSAVSVTGRGDLGPALARAVATR